MKRALALLPSLEMVIPGTEEMSLPWKLQVTLSGRSPEETRQVT